MSRYTILSLDPLLKGSLANLDLKIHGHYAGVYETSMALDEHVCSFIEEMNKKHGLSSERRFSPENHEWEKYENCFYAMVSTDEFAAETDKTQDDDSTPKVVIVWEKYAKPGRIYGETPRRRKIRLFISQRDQAGENETALENSSTKSVTASSETSEMTGVVTFDQVIDELKENLARRAARLENPAPVAERARTTPTRRAEVKRLSQVKKLDELNFDDCFPKVSSPLKFSKSTAVSTPTHSSDSDDEKDDPLKNYVHVHINPLWQPERDSFGNLLPLAPPPPTYEQVIQLSEKYSIHNKPAAKVEQDSWSTSSSSIEDDTEIISSDDESSEEVFYQRVRRGVIAYLAPRKLSAYSASPMDTETSDNEISDESDEAEQQAGTMFGHYSWPTLNHPSKTVRSDDVFTPLLTDEERQAYKIDDQVAEEKEEEEGATEWLDAYQKIIDDWRISRGLPVIGTDDVEPSDDDEEWSSSSELSSSSSSEIYISTRPCP